MRNALIKNLVSGQSKQSLKVLVDEVANVTYVGTAAAGSALSAPVWRIKRITDNNGDLTVELANGNEFFINVWNDRVSLSYL
jgi:hypothetical protein